MHIDNNKLCHDLFCVLFLGGGDLTCLIYVSLASMNHIKGLVHFQIKKIPICYVFISSVKKKVKFLMITFTNYLHIVYFNGLQTVEGQNYSFSAASMGRPTSFFYLVNSLSSNSIFCKRRLTQYLHVQLVNTDSVLPPTSSVTFSTVLHIT